MSNNFPGSRWWKFDFHTHTPASSDYNVSEREIVTPQDWLLAYMHAEIDAVVVTDHNCVDWIEALQDTLKELNTTRPEGWRELVLFPGVEITTSEQVHLLAVFAPETPSMELNGLLHGSDVSWDKPNHTSGNAEWRMSNVNTFEMMSRIHQKGGLAIPAHVDTTRGLLASQSASEYQAETPTSRAILNALANADAIDVRNPLDPVMTHFFAQIQHKAMVDGSDSPHQLDNIGSGWVWLKMSNPSFAGLQLALQEPKLSLRRKNCALEPMPNQWIESLTFEGLGKGRRKTTINFNPWFNTIIGGRGSGKSTIVESLRLVLGGKKAPIDDFFNGMVRPETRLSVIAQTNEKGIERYRYNWKKDVAAPAIQRPDFNDPSVWIDTNISFYVSDVLFTRPHFLARIYSQKEIFVLASELIHLLKYIDGGSLKQTILIEGLRQQFGKDLRTGESLGISTTANGRGLIGRADTFSISNCVSRFKEARVKVRQLQSDLAAWPQTQESLAQKEHLYATYAKEGVSDTLALLQKTRQEKRTVNDFLQGLQSEVARLTQSIVSPNLTDWEMQLPANASPQALGLAKTWQSAISQMQTTWHSIEGQIKELGKAADNLSQASAYTEWQLTNQATDNNHLQALEQVKTKLGGQIQRVGELQQELDDLRQRNKLFEAKSVELAQSKRDVETAYAEMWEARQAITKARQAFVDEVIAESKQDLIQINIHCASHYDAATATTLRELLGLPSNAEYVSSFLGSLEDQDSKGVLPELTTSTERLFTLKTELDELINSPQSNTKKILNTSIERAWIRDTLKRLSPSKLDELWTWFPEDRVEFKFRTTVRDAWQDLSQGSAGQKTGALLSFILSQGNEPLILDQPEDDLDNEMIYNLLVQQLRENKSRRQVIVVTHNANIVVNADAEMVIPMSYRRGQIQVDANGGGGLQEAAIRRKICDVLEGGEKAFKQRYTRVLGNLGNLR